MEEATLQSDLESLARVRNRLIYSPDSALPKILTGLLPRLLERLENNHDKLGTTTSSTATNIPPTSTESQRSLRDKTQAQLTAILSHAIERIRGGQHTILSGSPWIPAILGMLETRDIQSPLAMTFLLLILQHSMPLHANYMEDLKYSNNSNNDHLSTACPPEEIIDTLPALSRFVDKLHQRLAVCSSNPNETVRETLLLHYRTSSWICLDVVALSWGLPALIDWERDQFDEYEWSTPASAKEAFLEHGPSRHAHNNNTSTISNASQNYLECTGAFQLWLDLLLFWPSNDNHDISRPRRRIVRTEAEIMIENSTGMTPEGLKRLHHRCKNNSIGGQQSWNVRYLRELKLACMEYIVVPPVRTFLLSNRNNQTNLLSTDAEGDNLPFLRCLILCILTASTGSMHGKVAIDYLNKMSLLISTNINNIPTGKATKTCRSQSTTPVDAPGPCNDDGSLLLACSLLTLILGDRVASKALQRHPEGRARVETLLGPLSTSEEVSVARADDTNDIMETDGTPLNNDTADTPESPLQRAPLPFDVAERAIDFILTSLMPSLVEGGRPSFTTSKRNVMTDGEILPVFVDLVVALSKSKGATGSYFAIQLIGGLYSQCACASDDNQVGMRLVEDTWIRAFHITCIDIASQVLSHVAEVDAETRITLGEIQQTPGQPALPGGVPHPFPGRRDLNMMLVRHRSSQKRKQLRASCALEARRKAYEIVTELASSVGITDASQKNAILSKQSPMLEMPIILLKCAAFEEYTCMRPYVTGALDSLLVVYRESLSSVATVDLNTLVASLLPSLLCAVCSDASAARLSAARWVVDFVQPLDPGVMWHVCSFLADDIDAFVSDVAKQALASNKVDTPMEHCLPEFRVQFLSFESEEDRARIRNELEWYVAKTASSLNISASVCRVLLSEFKFDTSKVIGAYNADRASILVQCGVLGRASQIGDHVVAMSSSNKLHTCGICYDEFEGDGGYKMCCNHSFCTSCWTSYLSCFLGDRLTSSCMAPVSLICPEQKCAERIIAEDVQVVAPELLSRWNDCVLWSFISSSKSFRTCPGPDCCVVAQQLATEEELATCGTATAVQCSECTTKFCFSCGSDPHQPARCADFADWNRIFGSSQFWVKTNAKPCPNCNIPIEKNNGCNHIHCTCGHDWCWLCLTTLGSHLEPHICNRYEPHQSAENDDERRALFFTDRFKAHDDAEQFAVREVRSFEEKREKLSTEVLWFASDEDLDNMYTAATTLVRARNFLKNSYVAAWAMRKDLEHRDVFESHQANLELFCEKLSQLLLTKVHQLYIEHGARAIHMHFRAMTFSTGSVTKYMDRILSFMSTG